jgi:hypothetical protein
MSIIKSKINTNSAAYKDNYQKMLAKIEELNKHLNNLLFQGEEKHLGKSKITRQILSTRTYRTITRSRFTFFRIVAISWTWCKRWLWNWRHHGGWYRFRF